MCRVLQPLDLRRSCGRAGGQTRHEGGTALNKSEEYMNDYEQYGEVFIVAFVDELLNRGIRVSTDGKRVVFVNGIHRINRDVGEVIAHFQSGLVRELIRRQEQWLRRFKQCLQGDGFIFWGVVSDDVMALWHYPPEAVARMFDVD